MEDFHFGLSRSYGGYILRGPDKPRPTPHTPFDPARASNANGATFCGHGVKLPL